MAVVGVILVVMLCLQVSALKLAPTGTRGPLAALFGVFDGHGGDGASKFVANHLHHLVRYSWEYFHASYPSYPFIPLDAHIVPSVVHLMSGSQCA